MVTNEINLDARMQEEAVKGAEVPQHKKRGKAAASLPGWAALELKPSNAAAANDADLCSNATPAGARLSAPPQVPFATS